MLNPCSARKEENQPELRGRGWCEGKQVWDRQAGLAARDPNRLKQPTETHPTAPNRHQPNRPQPPHRPYSSVSMRPVTTGLIENGMSSSDRRKTFPGNSLRVMRMAATVPKTVLRGTWWLKMRGIWGWR